MKEDIESKEKIESEEDIKSKESKEKSDNKIKNFFKKNKKIIIPIIIICIISISVYLSFKFSKEGEITYKLESFLKEKKDISILETVEYPYVGIIAKYKDSDEYKSVNNETKEDVKDVEYYIKYRGIVNAGIDFNKIKIDASKIEGDKKILEITIPEVIIQKPEYKDFDILNIKNINTEDYALQIETACKKDLENKIKNDANLIESAKNNAKKTINDLISPLIKKNNKYKIVIK